MNLPTVFISGTERIFTKLLSVSESSVQIKVRPIGQLDIGHS